MPYIVGGKSFHEMRVPGPKLVPEHHHVALMPVTVRSEAASKGSALSKAEHMMATAAGDAEEVILSEIVFLPAELGSACMMTGIPIKYLNN